VVLLLAVLALIGGVLVFREHQVRSRDAEAQQRYGAVQKAASAEVLALLNIDYRNPDATIKKVRAGATADFASQFDKATGGLVQLTAEAKSVMTAKVLWAGVVDLDADSASVIVATTGTVLNTETGNKAAARNFRIKVGLTRKDGRWLTSALDFVQVPL
jgi:Mce-associated membrane protein